MPSDPKPPKRAPKRLAPGRTLAAPTEPMRAMSEKRAEFYRDVYRPMRAEAVGDGHEPCQIVSPACTGYVEHLHEVFSRGRAGGLEAAVRDGAVVPCCDRCNGYVSENPLWAAENGWLVSAKGRES